MPVTLVFAVQVNVHDDPFARLVLQPNGLIVGELYAATLAPFATVGELRVGDILVTATPVLLVTVILNVALPPAKRHAAGAAVAVIAILAVSALTESVLEVALLDVPGLAFVLCTLVMLKVTVPLSVPLVV